MGHKFDNFRFIKGKLFITCNACAIEQPEENFWKHTQNELGRNYKCKTCHNNYSPDLESSDKKFAQPARKILIDMGFDIDKPIHPQFCERMMDKHGINLK